MTSRTTTTRYCIHLAFLAVCIGGFFLSCFGFLVYRLILKPLIFGLILVATLPLIGKELLKKERYSVPVSLRQAGDTDQQS